MIETLPKGQLMLKYEDFFNEASPDHPLCLIENYCKATVLGEFAGLNYRLKSKHTMYQDTSLDTQIELLFNFCGSNQNLFDKYKKLYSKFIKDENNYASIFTRQTCLYASEQIINSDLKQIDGFTLKNSWENLFKYLLAVNSLLIKQTDEPHESNNDENKTLNFETLNPKFIPLNELSIDVNPLYTPYRGQKLMEYLSDHKEFGDYFRDYIQNTYQITYDHFIYELLSMYYANNRDGKNDITNPVTGKKMDTSFFYFVRKDQTFLFNELSKVFKNSKTERLVSIKKYPFFKAANQEFLLTDNVLLLDKSYNQFINDFWFDCIKEIENEDEKPKYNIKFYRSIIGYFVETYCKEIFNYCFKNAEHYVLKMYDDLKIYRGKQEIEIADIYLRHTRNIFLVQEKSTGLYDDQKYTGDLNEMYRNNREGFFNSFGVKQIIDSIKNLRETITLVDPGFQLQRNYHIFPAIIVNEKAMQTPLMAQIFNDRFKEIINKIKTEKLIIHPLFIIHISDLENMEDHIQSFPSEFFRIIKYHLRSPEFIPPFYNSLNRLNVKSKFTKTRDLFEKLVLKYQKKE